MSVNTERVVFWIP